MFRAVCFSGLVMLMELRHCPVELLTGPASEPITVAELKANQRLNLGDSEDSELSRYITAARELFEKMAGRAVLPTQFRQHLAELSGPIPLIRGHVLSVQSVTYYDADDELQTLTGWNLDTAEVPAVVYLPDEDYPALSTKRRRPAYVEFTCGWANSGTVPAAVKVAILLMAGHYYRFREALTDAPAKELPYGFRAVCDLFGTGLNWGA